MLADLDTDFEEYSREEQQSLAHAARAGDQGAFESLCRSNIAYAVHTANGWRKTGVSIEDLEGAALLGLVVGMREYDPEKHARPIGYVKHRIRDALQKEVYRHRRTVRLSWNKQRLLHAVSRAREKLRQKLNRPPNARELAEEVGEEPAKVWEVLKYENGTESLYAPYEGSDDEGSEEGGALLDLMHQTAFALPDVETAEKDLAVLLERLLGLLPERQMRIIRLFAGVGCSEGMSAASVSNHVDVGKARCRQLRDEGLDRLRSWVENPNLQIDK